MRSINLVSGLSALLLPVVSACDDCYGPSNPVQHVRHVPRMQPGAPNAAYGPKGPLEWGQINFIHSTDSHGWLEGHLTEQNYGADWGDFASFTRRMKNLACDMGVDMLLIDTGDLHDGTGLSDATPVDGQLSMPIFNEIQFDLLTIGNHELYVAEDTEQMFTQYASQWGDRYLTSNVKIYNNKTGNYEYIGATHRYFKTEQGLRIMAFGVLYDFTGNSNISQVITASDMVQEQWFIDALHINKPIDLFVLIGHNPVRQDNDGSSLPTVWNAIRAIHPDTPIQIFGGHTHIRDFAVYDQSSTALESGRYCETLGWLSMSGFDKHNSGYRGPRNPPGMPHAKRPALANSTSPFLYSRRYMDWNRATFIYHSTGNAAKFDTGKGEKTTTDITSVRNELKLGQVYGCVPQSYFVDAVPFNASNNIFPGVIEPAAAAIIVNQTRKDNSRLIFGNTGGIRFDLYKGPFTYDDTFIVSPFRDVWFYIPNVPYNLASGVLAKLNAGGANKRMTASMPEPQDECINPSLNFLAARDAPKKRGVVRRQKTLVPGYVTTDDWGSDGDDTKHTATPYYDIPNYWAAQGNFPTDGSDPDNVDLIFVDFIEPFILAALGSGYTSSMVTCYVTCNFTSQDYLAPYAKQAWQANINNCPLS